MADLNQACRKSLFIIFMDQKACEVQFLIFLQMSFS